jgi:hypothetical protein
MQFVAEEAQPGDDIGGNLLFNQLPVDQLIQSSFSRFHAFFAGGI